MEWELSNDFICEMALNQLRSQINGKVLIAIGNLQISRREIFGRRKSIHIHLLVIIR